MMAACRSMHAQQGKVGGDRGETARRDLLLLCHEAEGRMPRSRAQGLTSSTSSSILQPACAS